MKIAFTGAGGFIGSYVIRCFKDYASDIYVLNREDSIESWKEIIIKSDVIINLAGSPIKQRWTKANRKKILDSRILTTRKIVQILNSLPEDISSKLFISASATGIYPNDKFKTYNEYNTVKGSGFLAEVVSKWEAEVDELVNPAVRLVIARLGVVLSKDGGMLKTLIPLFKSGLGGYIGDGKQITSFIHIEDVASAFKFFIENKNTSGLFNLVAPTTITNHDMTRVIAEKFNRPALITIPAFIFKIIFGEASCIILNGVNIYPEHLIDKGYEFKFPTFEKAINDIFGPSKNNNQ
ncbi:MAG: TIGR01777 family oxidoreductase [Prolixibacteraceae bacterium]|nr:TIGR01777 family oxidoreductase [Prolixibacteraceae bacterium]